jgi:molybdate/tungstate transport system substrate-binding protein
MERAIKQLSRRGLLLRGGRLAVAAAAAGLPIRLLAEEQEPLEVAYAGSMASIMEGPIKTAASRRLQVEMRGRAQGASGLAQLIVSGSIRPDVFISVTPGPMQTVLRAGKADRAHPIAHTEMVIAYSPRSRFAAKFQGAGKSGTEAWWQILEEPGIRFGRTDPVTDPLGRNIIFVMMLASKLYKQPDLVERVLGATINERQIFTEPSVEARLQSGEFDAASAYKIQPGPLQIPYISLPDAINLGGAASKLQVEHAEISLMINGNSYHPEPLIYYAAVLKEAAHPRSAAAFVGWLRGDEAQAIFRRYGYDPSGAAGPLQP